MQTNWPQWQQQVFTKIRHDYAEVLTQLTFDEVDWAAWRALYEQGRSANNAVDYAFAREPAEPPQIRAANY